MINNPDEIEPGDILKWHDELCASGMIYLEVIKISKYTINYPYDAGWECLIIQSEDRIHSIGKIYAHAGTLHWSLYKKGPRKIIKQPRINLLDIKD